MTATCTCGARIAQAAWACDDCHESWMDVEDSEIPGLPDYNWPDDDGGAA